MKFALQALFAVTSFSGVFAAPFDADTAEVVGFATDEPTIYARNARSNAIVATKEVGARHGDDVWDDASAAVAGKNLLRIGEIQMWCDTKNNGELQAVGFGFRDNLSYKKDFYSYKIHGTNASPPLTQTWTLGTDEYVTTINAYTYKAKGHTRIGSLVFNTNKRAGLASCGPKTGNKIIMGNPNWAFLYTSGTSGRVVDFMQTHWIDALTF